MLVSAVSTRTSCYDYKSVKKQLIHRSRLLRPFFAFSAFSALAGRVRAAAAQAAPREDVAPDNRPPYECPCLARFSFFAPRHRLSAGAARFGPPHGNRGGAAKASGHHRLRRNRFGQNHAAAQDGAGAGARQAERPGRRARAADWPHAAAPLCIRLSRCCNRCGFNALWQWILPVSHR